MLRAIAVRWAFLAAPFLGMAIVAALLLSAGLRQSFSHDESFYVSAAALTARRGLLPYRDYLYTHTPYLALLYAALFKFSSSLLLSSRLASVLFAVAALIVLMILTWRELDAAPPALRVFFALVGPFIVATSPLVLKTVGVATNQDLSILLGISSLYFCSRGMRQELDPRSLFLSGFWGGLAAGTRTPSAYLLAALFLIVLAFGLTSKSGGWSRGFLAFGAGGVLSLIPAGVLVLLAPSQALFGMVQYHLLNSALMARTGVWLGMGPWGKMQFVWGLISGDPRSLALSASLVVAVAWNLVPSPRSTPSHSQTRWFLCIALLAVFLGSLTNTPSQNQYFYPTVLFAVAALIALLAEKTKSRLGEVVVVVWMAALVLLGVGQSWLDFYRIRALRHPEVWIPVVEHNLGTKVAKLSGGGEVLTLTAMIPLEGGAPIYPWTEMGALGWRVAPLLNPEERASQHMVSTDDLASSLSTKPPSAILTGLEPEYDIPIIAYAKQNGYRPLKISADLTLWVRGSSP